MNEETFQRKLAELIAEIGTLPAGERDKLELLAEQTRQRHRQLKETVNTLQESIDFAAHFGKVLVLREGGQSFLCFGVQYVNNAGLSRVLEPQS